MTTVGERDDPSRELGGVRVGVDVDAGIIDRDADELAQVGFRRDFARQELPLLGAPLPEFGEQVGDLAELSDLE